MKWKVLKKVEENENTKENEITEENNTSELYVDKTFCNWDHVAKFMKKCVIAKGHRVQIGSSEKVDKTINEVIK